MKVIDADWTPKGNMLTLACRCDNVFKHPSWRRWAVCNKCGAKGDLIELKSMDAERSMDIRKEKSNESLET